MKKRKTTYGVYGLIEWGARIPFGKGCVQISFSGGSKTPNGIIPATYTTDNPVIQLAIEQSPDFRAGKIRSVRTIPLNEEIRVHTNPAPSLPVVEAPAAGVAPQSPCSAPAPSPADVASGHSPCSAPEQASSVAAQRQFRAEGVPVPEIPSPEAPSAALSPEPEVMASGSIPAASESASAPHVMEFACLPDAREYLKKEFGYEEREVRTTAQAKSAARSHGLEIIIA